MNYSEIVSKFKDLMSECDVSFDELTEIFYYMDHDDEDESEENFEAKVYNSLGEVDVVVSDARGGVAGDLGFDQTQNVLHFKDHNVYVGFDGWYDSWNGTSYSNNSFYECRPQEVTMTIYNRVKS